MKAIFALVFLFHSSSAAGLQEPEICYVLDAILFVYGTVLTALYCRLKILERKKSKPSANVSNYEQMQKENADIYEELKDEKPTAHGKNKKEEGIYTGLNEHHIDTYESLRGQVPGKV
ncbi:high affinity immunoglobulin epsilon receptor subunit gamma-like [Narcine bancroftii]|uniref:high affinity immunoglobulin epsilon receptor subunit gamma-like n=1 Tax=Narcine bancroftii TaxID=1343680 RepID=UPI0038319461